MKKCPFLLPLLTVLSTLVDFLQYFLLVQVKRPETAWLVHRYFLHDNQKKVSFSHVRSVLGPFWESSQKLVSCILVSSCWMYNHRRTFYFKNTLGRSQTMKILIDVVVSQKNCFLTAVLAIIPSPKAHTRHLIFLPPQLSWFPPC